MKHLNELIWAEKYRPNKFEDLILEDKSGLLRALDNPKSINSFIFYSSSPGTGKTSTARIIIQYLNCDYLMINSSDERGIDTIRDKIKTFSMALSSNEQAKRCIFLDEADGLTKQAQDSMRNLMETYSENCFFILSCNDIAKIIEPIRSRCTLINFERPNKADIRARLEEIVVNEKLKVDEKTLDNLLETCYADIRKMIVKLQQFSLDGKEIVSSEQENNEFLNLLKTKNIKQIYEKVYSGSFDFMSFNKWMFHRVFTHFDKLGLDKASFIAGKLADTEKYWNQGCNQEIIFIANMLEVSKIL